MVGSEKEEKNITTVTFLQEESLSCMQIGQLHSADWQQSGWYKGEKFRGTERCETDLKGIE